MIFEYYDISNAKKSSKSMKIICTFFLFALNFYMICLKKKIASVVLKWTDFLKYRGIPVVSIAQLLSPKFHCMSYKFDSLITCLILSISFVCLKRDYYTIFSCN